MRWPLMIWLVLPAPAFADFTATYRLPGSGTAMTIEIADNGDACGDVTVPQGKGIARTGVRFIIHADQNYLVQEGPSGPTVVRVADAATVNAENKAKRVDKTTLIPLSFVKESEVRVNGRTGTAYFARIGVLPPESQPGIVVSKDPALAPLMRAMLAQFDASTTIIGQTVDMPVFKAGRDVLETGAPLLSGGAKLERVRYGAIPAWHFEIPAVAASLDELRQHWTPIELKLVPPLHPRRYRFKIIPN
jgi:hypothetical protein